MDEADLSTRRGCAADLSAYARGLRLFWDPRGRSPRTELFAIALISTVIGPLIGGAFILAIPALPEGYVGFAVHLFVLAPIPAAAARRFHDMGKPGWLALPVLLLCLVLLWDVWTDAQTAPGSLPDVWSESAGMFFSVIIMLMAVLLMQPPKLDNNPYGPDPRPKPKEI